MRAEPVLDTSPPPRWCLPAVFLAGTLGCALIADSAWSISATYDEVAYLQVAAHWWRTGDQAEISRMGSPLTFWKLQQIPVLWLLDHTGRRALVDDPIARQAELLPLVRLGSIWIWVVALGLAAFWTRRLHGPRAMAFAAWLFALSPNLLAHGALITMELPLAASSSAVFLLFWLFLRTSSSLAFWSAAALCGLAFSCKFTAILFPPLLALIWWIDLSVVVKVRPSQAAIQVLRGMVGFLALMIASDIIVTGFAVLPLAANVTKIHPSLDTQFGPGSRAVPFLGRVLETPILQDWVGFVIQIRHQRAGGPSYLFGERRMTGWWYYYFIVLVVKIPLAFWALVLLRALWISRERPADRAWVLPALIGGFLIMTALGSTRNYGLRYLLPIAPLAVVWVSALAAQPGWRRVLACSALLGQAFAVVSVHPNELTYFNQIAGGPLGGKAILSDSNLDWGQGLKSLARLQRQQPQLRDLTFYYFGDTKPQYYGVAGVSYVIDANLSRPFPPQFQAASRFVAVSTSLRWGPWAPPDYFKAIKNVSPFTFTDDHTIAIYRTADIFPSPPLDSGSIKIKPARKPFLQTVGSLGDSPG